MKKLLKKIFIIVIILLVVGAVGAVLAAIYIGKNSTTTYKMEASTGDTVGFTFLNSSGYTVGSSVDDSDFKIRCDGQTVVEGSFISTSEYTEYVDEINSEESTLEVIDSGTTEDGIEYIIFEDLSVSDEESSDEDTSDEDSDDEDSGEEWNCIISIEDSDTAIIFGNDMSGSSVQEVFDAVTIFIY